MSTRIASTARDKSSVGTSAGSEATVAVVVSGTDCLYGVVEIGNRSQMTGRPALKTRRRDRRRCCEDATTAVSSKCASWSNRRKRAKATISIHHYEMSKAIDDEAGHGIAFPRVSDAW